ncbi:MAG: hypothetical protein N2037_06200, partial [Acidimicrobiales bacterium]|nr:hypothetical protein [Acidimicrobiales bacterium]
EHRPIPDPAKLLAYWNEWERGETTPGRTMSNLKTAGLPELLQALIDASWRMEPRTGERFVPRERSQSPGT